MILDLADTHIQECALDGFGASPNEFAISAAGPAAQVVLLVGDLTYADNYFTNGTLRPPMTPPKAYQETFQPRWDAWGRFVEPLASQVIASSVLLLRVELHRRSQFFYVCFCGCVVKSSKLAWQIMKSSLPRIWLAFSREAMGLGLDCAKASNLRMENANFPRILNMNI